MCGDIAMIELIYPHCGRPLTIDDTPRVIGWMTCSRCATLLKLQVQKHNWIITPVEDLPYVEDINPNDLMEIPGVNTILAAALRQEGYATLWDVAFETPENLAANTGILLGKAIQIVDAVSQLLHLDEDEDYQEYLEYEYDDVREEDSVDW
jgi:hypothetical protein